MNENMKNAVVVIEDADGALYTITPEIFRMGLVADPKHESEIREYIKESAGANSIEEAFPSFKFVGSYKRNLDERIRRDYVPPRITLVSSESAPNP